jgi:hypothetical protein
MFARVLALTALLAFSATAANAQCDYYNTHNETVPGFAGVSVSFGTNGNNVCVAIHDSNAGAASWVGIGKAGSAPQYMIGLSGIIVKNPALGTPEAVAANAQAQPMATGTGTVPTITGGKSAYSGGTLMGSVEWTSAFTQNGQSVVVAHNTAAAWPTQHGSTTSSRSVFCLDATAGTLVANACAATTTTGVTTTGTGAVATTGKKDSGASAVALSAAALAFGSAAILA